MASSGHTASAIAKVCEELQADSPFYGSRSYSGLYRRLAETVKELGSWGFEPQTLATLAPECSEDLAPKLKSLASIWEAAENLLGEFNAELSYRHIAHSLTSNPNPDVVFPPCLIFLDGQLSPKHVDWVRWAVSVGGKITIVVDGSPSSADLFLGSQEIERLFQTSATPMGESSAFVRSLFAGTVALEPEIQVVRTQAADPLSEVEWTFRQCLESLPGNEYHRLGIYARNLEEYGPLIESAASRLGVPIRMALKASLASNGYIRALNSVVRVLASSDVRRLEVLTKSSFFLFPNALRRPFQEALATAFRENDQAWPRMEGWAAEHQDELNWLPVILTWRREAVAKPTTLGGWRERLRELGNLFPAIALGQTSERDLRAKNSFERALGSRATFTDRAEMTLDQLLIEIKTVTEDSDYTPPVRPVGIQVSDSPAGFAALDHLFVLGMLEGVFPRRRRESPILTDRDRDEISDRRALMMPLRTSFDEAQEERGAFVTLCSVPSTGITFSHPETTDERDNIPAFYLEEVKRAIGGEIPHRTYRRADLAPSLEECLAENDRKLRVALDQVTPFAGPLDVLTEEVRSDVAARVPEALQARHLRSALECPFRHFAQEALRLYPDRDRRRWYQLRGLPQSSQLMKQEDADSARQSLQTLLASELEEMRPHVTESEFELMRQGGERLIQDWVRREFRARQIWPKDAGSKEGLVSFGSPTLRGVLPRVGKVAGTVAGTSRMGRYKVVHLVESNTPSDDKSSLLGMKDRDALYYGMHLMAGFEKGSSLALEIESMAGGRKLMLLPRLEEPIIVGDVGAGMMVTDLAGKGDAPVTSEVFFERVKDLLGQASKAIREVDVRATPGDHCTFCDHGELCRQSAEFGEEDSPFEGENG